MRDRLTALLLSLPVCVWAVYIAAGDHIAARLSSRYGARILAGGDGKFNDVQFFVANRLRDAAVIVTAACLLFLAYRIIAGVVRRRLTAPASWVVKGWAAFILLNVFVGIASQTALIWCVLYTGKVNVQNYTQWRVKQALLRETRAPLKAVLLGSSQTRTQIDAKALNQRLGRKVWTTELHFPGSTIYDMLVSLERLPKTEIDYVIIYICEANFYTKNDNRRLMYFFGLRDLPGYWSLGVGRPHFDRFMVSGLWGDIFPLYQIWDPLMARTRVWETHNLAQEKYDAALENDLSSRARRAATGIRLGANGEFEKRAFAAFAKACRERGARLIVCCGQVNPILTRALDPAVRPDMVGFLRGQAARDSNIILLQDGQLPPQSEDDYEDLTHVNAATRARFSQYLAGILEEVIRTNSTILTARSRNVRENE